MTISRIKTGILSLTNGELLHGLPFEIWRIVLAFLCAKDLCCCSQVCKDWRALVDSLDTTRWKQIYLLQERTKRWKHPNWPNESSSSPALKSTWKDLYRKRFQLSRLWLRNQVAASCVVPFLFPRRKSPRTFHVGLGKQYQTIKAALDKASPYAKIIVHPGTYQDSSILYLKYPIAILGIDDASNITLMMQIEIRCDSVKMENLTIKPLYVRARGRGSSTAIIRALTGHLCLFNCIVTQGCISVVSPGSVTVLNCTFTSAFIKFVGVGYSSITGTDFIPNRIAICIEEPLFQYPVRPTLTSEDVGGWIFAANDKAFDEYYKGCIKGGCSKRNIQPEIKAAPAPPILSDTEYSDSESDMVGRVGGTSNNTASTKASSKDTKSQPKDNSILDSNTRGILKTAQGVIINNIRVSNGWGGITVYRMGQAWIENSTFHNLVYGIRCLQSSKCIILNNKIHDCETMGVFFRDHSTGLVAGNQIFSNGEAGIDIRSNANPIIQHNEIYGGQRSGVVCLENGKGMIRENDIYNNKEAAIYILHHGNPKIKNNFICSGKASGIAVTENGRGHITQNVITGMEWAGIDVRHGGNPVISHNIIKNGQSDGIVIGDQGKSVIFDNTIEGNSGCGIWILDGSHPLVHSNRIIYSGSNGIAFVSKSDQEHDRKFESHLIQNDPSSRQHDANDGHGNGGGGAGGGGGGVDGFIFEEDGFPIAPINFALPEIEPESRYIHVSKPDKTVAQIESNHVENNRGCGILYDGKEGIVISKNRISGNSKHGIALLRSNEITIDRNTIRNNLLSGINVEVGVCCSIHKNGIYDNKEHGIHSGGLGLIKLNDILSHASPSLFIRTYGNLTVTQNRLHSWKHECVFVEEKCRVILEENEFFITLEPPASELCVLEKSDITYVENRELVHRLGPIRYRDGLKVEDLIEIFENFVSTNDNFGVKRE
eukprot:TCONS_00073696-protein